MRGYKIMEKFKVGDLVRYKLLYESSAPPDHENHFVVQCDCNDSYYLLPKEYSLGSICKHGKSWVARDFELELISSAPTHKAVETNMNLKEKLLLAMKPEPEKSFRKLGITNGDDMLTEEGKELYYNWKFQQDKAQFKTEVVDKLLEEMKDEKECK